MPCRTGFEGDRIVEGVLLEQDLTNLPVSFKVLVLLRQANSLWERKLTKRDLQSAITVWQHCRRNIVYVSLEGYEKYREEEN